MRHPLEVKLRRYRSRTRAYSTLTVTGYLLAIYAFVLFLLGMVDWYLRPTSLNFRLLLWLFALAPLSSIPVLLTRAFRRRRSDVELAKDLEKKLPPLRNWLAVAIDFLHVKKESPTAGSKELRDAVIDRATHLSDDLDFAKTLNQRSVYRSMGVMALVLVLATILVTLYPQVALTASRRLAQPLTPIAWPQKTLLKVEKSPIRLAKGSSFQATLTDEHGRSLPEDATIFYRFDQEKIPVEAKAEKTPSGKSDKIVPTTKPAATTIEVETIRTDGRKIVVFRDRVDRSFSFRATSGDDRRMLWQTVTVVEPPAVELFQAVVTPPAYLGDVSPVTLPVMDRLCLREGSQVRFLVTVSKPVRQATLLLDDMEYDGKIEEAGRRIVFPTGGAEARIPIDRSCSIALRLEDRLGLEVLIDRSQQIELIENQPPTITLLHPKGNDRIVAGAIVPIEASVEDDLGIRTVEMHGTIEGGEGASGVRSFSEVIYQGPAQLPATSQNVGTCPAEKQKLTIDYRWDLAPLNLTADERLSLRVVATDYSNLSTASELTEITVVPPASFIDQLASDQRAITEEMAQALAISQRNLQRMNQVRQQLEQTGEVRMAEMDLLRAIMLDRSQVVRTLTDENDGLIARSTSILAKLEDSRLQVRSLRNRLVRLIANLKTLQNEILPVIEQNTTRATKNAELKLDPQSKITVETAEVLSPLATAALAQEQLIDRLRVMLGRLDDLIDHQRFCDDLKRLIQSQQTLTDQTKTLGRSLLGRAKMDLEPTELTRLEEASRNQAQLARESSQMVSQMIQAARRISETETNRIATAVESPASRTVGTTLTQASEAILQNQLGHAVQLQTESLAQLQTMLDQMAQTSGTESEGEASPEQSVQIEGTEPGESSSQEGEQPTSVPQQDTGGPPGEQSNEAASFAPESPTSKTTTHLKPRTVDDIVERLWGELPDRERERLIQLPGERFLPGYERQIEQYYQNLLE